MDANPIDQYARDRIRYRVTCLIGRFGYTQSDRDDLTQELTMHLLESLPHHDPARSSRKTFISRMLDRKVRSLIRYRIAEKRDFGRQDHPLSSIDPDDPQLDEEAHRYRRGLPSTSPSERSDLETDIASALPQLPEELQRVTQVLARHPRHKAAKALGVGRGRFNKMVAELREHLEAAGIDLEFIDSF